jgi:hypothetical protein
MPAARAACPDSQRSRSRNASIPLLGDDDSSIRCEGSLACRYRTCNNPNCRCADPDQRHGPYWQLSWKQAGTTVSRNLPAVDAALYRQWIANRRTLEQILDEMRDLSRQAGEHTLASRGRPFHGPQRPRRRAP